MNSRRTEVNVRSGNVAHVDLTAVHSANFFFANLGANLGANLVFSTLSSIRNVVIYILSA